MPADHGRRPTSARRLIERRPSQCIAPLDTMSKIKEAYIRIIDGRQKTMVQVVPHIGVNVDAAIRRGMIVRKIRKPQSLPDRT
jgi:hypothetical protein